jgi:hypothetical protein
MWGHFPPVCVNRISMIEIERGKLMQQSSRLRDELQQLQ